MSVIGKDVQFGVLNLIERTELNNLDYNTTIHKVQNCEVVFDDGTGTLKKLARDCVLNPKQEGFFKGLFSKKKDPKHYVVYFVHTAEILSSNTFNLGGNVNVHNKNIPELQDEKVFYRISYGFKITDAKQFIQQNINVNKQYYTQDDIWQKIGELIQIHIKQVFAKSLKLYGFEKFSENLLSIKREMETTVNEDEEIWAKGFEIIITNIVKEEDPTIKEKQEDTELKKYQRRMSMEEN